jgi:hypothetical protein
METVSLGGREKCKREGAQAVRDFDFVEINTTEDAPSLRGFRKGGNSDCVQ